MVLVTLLFLCALATCADSLSVGQEFSVSGSTLPTAESKWPSSYEATASLHPDWAGRVAGDRLWRVGVVQGEADDLSSRVNWCRFGNEETTDNPPVDGVRCGRYRGDDVAIDTDPSWGTAGSRETHWLVHLANVTHAPDGQAYPTVGSLVSVHRGDHRASLVLRVLHVDGERDLALTVAVPPQSAFGNVSLRFRVGVPEHLRKRAININVNKSAPEPGADPIKFGLYNSPLEMGSTWLGLGVECIECSIAVQPYIEFELDMRLGWRDFRMSNVRFFSGSTIDIAQVMRYTVQGAANFISYRIPLAPRIDWGPPTGIPFAIGPVVGTAKPYLVLGASFGAMAIGAVDLTMGVRMGLGSGLGIGWSEGGGLSMESRVLREPYITPELDLSVVPTRSNPRIKVYGALQILAGVKLWGLVSPYVAFRAPELSAEWLFKTPGCPGAGYRASLGLRTFGGISLFPGFGKKHGKDNGNGQRNAVFGELEFTGGLPLEVDKLLPSVELASGCIADAGDEMMVAGAQALTSSLAAVEHDAGASGPVEVSPIGYTNEQPATALVPALPLPVYEESVPLSTAVIVEANGGATIHVTSLTARPMQLEMYVRMCLSSLTTVDVATTLEPILSTDLDSSSVSTFVDCPVGTMTTLVTGPGLGVDASPFSLEVAATSSLHISMDSPLVRHLLATADPLGQRAQVVFMEVGSDTIAGSTEWRPLPEWTTSDGGVDDDEWMEWLTHSHDTSPLLGGWSPCARKCVPEKQQRSAFCFAGVGCLAVLVPLQEERDCPVYRCPVYPLAWSTVSGSTALPLDSDAEFIAVETPGVVSIGWTGGSPLDEFEVDIRVAGCEGDASKEEWQPVLATITSADNPDFLDDLGLSDDESTWTDEQRLDFALGSTSWRAELSIPALARGVQTRLRVRPISTYRDCSDTSRALVSPLLSISSRRLMQVIVFDKDGAAVDPSVQPIFGRGGSDLVAVGAATSVSLTAPSHFEAFASTTAMSWVALDSGRVHTVHLESLHRLRDVVAEDQFPLTVTLIASQPETDLSNVLFFPQPFLTAVTANDAIEEGHRFQVRARLTIEFGQVQDADELKYHCAVHGGQAIVLPAYVECTEAEESTASAGVDMEFSSAVPLDRLTCDASDRLTLDYHVKSGLFDIAAATAHSFSCDMESATALRSVDNSEEEGAAVLVVVLAASAGVVVLGACACTALICLAIVVRRRRAAALVLDDEKQNVHVHHHRSHSRRRSTHALHHHHVRNTSPSPPPPTLHV